VDGQNTQKEERWKEGSEDYVKSMAPLVSVCWRRSICYILALYLEVIQLSTHSLDLKARHTRKSIYGWRRKSLVALSLS